MFVMLYLVHMILRLVEYASPQCVSDMFVIILIILHGASTLDFISENISHVVFEGVVT